MIARCHGDKQFLHAGTNLRCAWRSETSDRSDQTLGRPRMCREIRIAISSACS